MISAPTCHWWPRLRAWVRLFLALAVGPAVLAEPLELDYTVRRWTDEDGLPTQAITTITQSHDRQLWLGTDDSLVSFDGREWVSYRRRTTPALAQGRVNQVVEDSDGTLWIATAGAGVVAKQGPEFRRFGPSAGLSNELARTISLGPTGTLWVGTDGGGVFRRLGERFESLPGQPAGVRHVNGVLETADGAVFVTVEGAAVWRWRSGTWQKLAYAPPKRANAFTGLFSGPSGTVWVMTTEGLCRVAGDAVEPFPVPLIPTDVAVFCGAEFEDGELWLGTSRDLLRRRGGEWTRMNVGGGFSERGHSTLVRDHQGSLWCVPDGQGLVQLKRARFTAVGEPEGLSHDEVTSLARTGNGDLWLATAKGLNRINAGGIRRFTAADGLPDEFIFSLHVDVADTLWLGTRTQGIHRFADGRFTRVTNTLGRPPIWALAGGRHGEVFAGTRYGLLVFRDGLQTAVFRGTNGLSHDDVRAIADDAGGNLWVGTSYGLNLIRDGRVATNWVAPDGMPLESVVTLHARTNGSLWIGTLDRGLFRHREGKFTRALTADGLPDNNIHQILDDGHGRLWFTSGNGIFHAPADALEAAADRGDWKGVTFTSHSVRDGLRSTEFNGTIQPAGLVAGGRLWFPTSRGAAVVNLDQFASPPVPPRVLLHGLMLDLPTESWTNGPLELGANGRWQPVPRERLANISEARPERRLSIAGDRPRRRGPRPGGPDGGRGGEDRPPRGQRERRGGPGEGPPEDRPGGGRPPDDGDGPGGSPRDGKGAESDRTRRNRGQTINRPREAAGKQRVRVNSAGPLRLPPRSTFLEFEFAAADFLAPQSLAYEFQLTGRDEAWAEYSPGQESVFYTGLEPGDYTFRVRARNPGGGWSDPELAVRIEILPAWFQTPAARAAPLLAVFALGWGGYRWRLRAVERQRDEKQRLSRLLIESQEAERRRLASELHDSLSQTLLVVKNRAWMGQQPGQAPEKMARQLREISEAAENALEEVRALSHALRPPELDRLGLTRAFVALGERLAEAGGPAIIFSVDPVDGTLPSELEINLFRIAQEAINNALKHAQATRIELSLRREPATLLLTVRDDGQGFTPAPTASGAGAKRSGLGLSSMQERARILGGELTLESAPGRGTRLTAVIPLPPDRCQKPLPS